MKRAIWNDKVIAESDKTIEIEGNHYFPPDSIKKEFLTSSQTQTFCTWKGDANYYNIQIGNKIISDAAWFYPNPSGAADSIKGYVAFWKGVRVE